MGLRRTEMFGMDSCFKTSQFGELILYELHFTISVDLAQFFFLMKNIFYNVYTAGHTRSHLLLKYKARFRVTLRGFLSICCTSLPHFF